MELQTPGCRPVCLHKACDTPQILPSHCHYTHNAGEQPYIRLVNHSFINPKPKSYRPLSIIMYKQVITKNSTIPPQAFPPQQCPLCLQLISQAVYTLEPLLVWFFIYRPSHPFTEWHPQIPVESSFTMKLQNHCIQFI